MLLKLSFFALLAIALGQTIAEKGNLGELIEGVFGKNPQAGGGEPIPNEKVLRVDRPTRTIIR